MLEMQTDGAATERFQIIFFDNAKTALASAVFFIEPAETRTFIKKNLIYY